MAPAMVCAHPRCGQPVQHGNARFKHVAGLPGLQPFHTACSYAGPTHDVSKGCGSPFTTITGGTI